MKKRVLIRATALILSLLITGCGSASQETSVSSEVIDNNTDEIQTSSDNNDELLQENDIETDSNGSANTNNETEELSDEAIDASDLIEDDIEKEIEKQNAEEEAKIKAEEEAKLKAEEEARLKAEEEAKIKAEEEARLKAEEEAKIKAEEEAKLKAEEEAKLKAEEEAKQKAEEERVKAEQLNSFSIMYYLAIAAEEIRSSKDNRLVLDDIYTSLLNDINPGAVDEITQDHLKNLRDIIKTYRNITVKRDRLQYIYNKDKAAAIRSAVPNPIAILSMTNSLDWKRLAMSAVYAVTDSYNSYKKASENADKDFLMSGWELDDEELATVQKNRDRAFDYMVDMVQEYHLDGLKTLSEKDIEKFAEICNIESIPERISRLVSEEESYNLLGNYWLELADCYFQTGKYDKSLECVNKYDELATGIFRKDYNYAQILPKAIVAAQNTYKGSRYISNIQKYADAIIKNTSTEDWSIRYFVAEVYLDLYARTKDSSYLNSAYKIAHDNVTNLLSGQRALNKTYMADVQEVKVEEPDYSYMNDKEKKEAKEEYKKEKKRAANYNKAIKEERITELPSLYEPLILNCELLFALADELNIEEEEKKDIEAILQTNSNGTFLTKPINDKYSFSASERSYSIDFNKNDIAIPATLLTAGSEVTVTVTENGNKTVFDDVSIQKVVRKDKSIDTFTAYYESKTLKKHKWQEDSKVTISIRYTDANDKTDDFNYEVVEYQEHFYGDKVVFGEA